jgi:uncharacterized protein YecE (DUF72 family)
MAGTLHVGCCGYPVDRARYQAALDFVELQDSRRTLPRPAVLERMRAAAPPGFAFALVGPEALSDPECAVDLPGGPAAHGAMRPTPENVALLDAALVAAARLGAVLRLHTTPDLGAGPDALERFRALLAAVDRRGVRIAWEQRGVLTDREVIRWSGQLGLIPVVDPFQDRPPDGPTGYIRIHSLMTLVHGLHAEHFARILERAARHEETFVVFDTPTSFRDACSLRRLAAGGPAEPAADEDEPGEDASAGA